MRQDTNRGKYTVSRQITKLQSDDPFNYQNKSGLTAGGEPIDCERDPLAAYHRPHERLQETCLRRGVS